MTANHIRQSRSPNLRIWKIANRIHVEMINLPAIRRAIISGFRDSASTGYDCVANRAVGLEAPTLIDSIQKTYETRFSALILRNVFGERCCRFPLIAGPVQRSSDSSRIIGLWFLYEWTEMGSLRGTARLITSFAFRAYVKQAVRKAFGFRLNT